MQYIPFKVNITKVEELYCRNEFTDHGMGGPGDMALETRPLPLHKPNILLKTIRLKEVKLNVSNINHLFFLNIFFTLANTYSWTQIKRVHFKRIPCFTICIYLFFKWFNFYNDFISMSIKKTCVMRINQFKTIILMNWKSCILCQKVRDNEEC